MLTTLASFAAYIWLIVAIVFGVIALISIFASIVSIIKDMQGGIYMTDTETLLFSIVTLILVIIIGTRNKQLH